MFRARRVSAAVGLGSGCGPSPSLSGRVSNDLLAAVQPAEAIGRGNKGPPTAGPAPECCLSSRGGTRRTRQAFHGSGSKAGSDWPEEIRAHQSSRTGPCVSGSDGSRRTRVTESRSVLIAMATATGSLCQQIWIQGAGTGRFWTLRSSDHPASLHTLQRVPLDPFSESGRPGSLQFPDSLCPPGAGSQRRGPRSLFTPPVVPLRDALLHTSTSEMTTQQ